MSDLMAIPQLTGSLSPLPTLTGALSEVLNYQVYNEAYEVTPKANYEQTLNTENKFMMKDVTVKKIPCYRVNNTSNGRTVYIGSEVE